MERGKSLLTGLAAGIAVALAPTLSQAQWSYPGCSDVSATQFSYQTIVPPAEVWEPSDVAINMTPSGGVDVYYTELDNNGTTTPARVRRRLDNGTFQTLAALPIWQGPYGRGQANLEEGITGIVLDPNFNTNNWLYIHWTPASAVVYRISRFTVSNNTLTDERVVLDIPMQREDCCHTGGGMAFDNDGNLWIAQGNNGGRGVNRSGPTGIGISETSKYLSDEWGASSTGGLRGGILRIKPTASGTPAYTNVTGNFRDYYGGQGFDATKIRPEIFTKGSRNAYKLDVDPVRKWVAWGDVGPDANTVSGSNQHEEFNLRTTPAFMGWPYFVGNNLAYSGTKTVSAPTNTSKWNAELNGLTTLPAAQPAFYSEGQGSNTGVAFYQFNPAVNITGKFPPHFHQKWFYTAWGHSQVNVVETNASGTSMVSRRRIFSNGTFAGPTALRFGPDGRLYIANYNGLFSSGNSRGIVRISYTGPNCTPTSVRPQQGHLNPGSRFAGSLDGWVVNLGAKRPILVPQGVVGFELYDLMGKKVWELRNLRPGMEFKLPEGLRRGALKYRWVTPQ